MERSEALPSERLRGEVPQRRQRFSLCGAYGVYVGVVMVKEGAIFGDRLEGSRGRPLEGLDLHMSSMYDSSCTWYS